MNTYKIFKHPAQGITAVKSGFSWPAFFLFPIWFIYKKLGQELIRIITFIGSICGVIITFVAAYNYIAGNEPFFYTPTICGLAGVIMGIIYCFKANELYASRLQELGYELISTVEANNISSAIGLITKNA